MWDHKWNLKSSIVFNRKSRRKNKLALVPGITTPTLEPDFFLGHFSAVSTRLVAFVIDSLAVGPVAHLIVRSSSETNVFPYPKSRLKSSSRRTVHFLTVLHLIKYPSNRNRTNLTIIISEAMKVRLAVFRYYIKSLVHSLAIALCLWVERRWWFTVNVGDIRSSITWLPWTIR